VDAVIWRRLAAVLNHALDNKPNMRIKIVVLRGGNREDDWTLSAEMHDAIEAVHRGRSELVPYTTDLQDTLSSIASCDAFIATRYHAGVLAYLAGCNLLFLAYHRKVYDLAREIGLSDSACVTPTEDLAENDLMKKISHLIEGRDLYRARLPVSEAARRAWINIQTLGDTHERAYAASR
jgi:polysaccharide pyruvyl transferase WcaK-like protein